MVKLSLRLLLSLSIPQRILTFFTLLLPLLIHTLASWVTAFTCGRNCLMVGPFSIIHWAIFAVWFLMAAILLSWVVSTERSDTKRHIDEKFEALSAKMELQEKEFRRITTGLQDRINDLQDWVSALRETMEEQLDIELPGRRISARADPISVHVSVSAAEGTVGRSPFLIVRLRSWVKRRVVRVWRLTRKLVWDWNEDGTNHRG